MSDIYLGLLSGTSMDGIDAALVDFSTAQPKLLASLQHDIPADIRERYQALTQATLAANKIIPAIGQLDALLGGTFADAAGAVLMQSGIEANAVAAIGLHGQTLWHATDEAPAFTWQIGDANRVAAATGIITVADLRRMDVAFGGEGAPLACAFHRELLRDSNEATAVVNIGGIANTTLVPADSSNPTIGFDCGPGNNLMDGMAQRHLGQPYDRNGAFAASGTVDENLLELLLNDAYFALPAPKSTGPEYFNRQWLNRISQDFEAPRSEDLQATLAELTACSIAQSIPAEISRVLICGGGVHNEHLMGRIAAARPDSSVDSTAAIGIDPDYVEAMLFAWLAKKRLAGEPGNDISVTGAGAPAVLGAIYAGR